MSHSFILSSSTLISELIILISLDPVLVFTQGTTNLFEFVERRYFENLDEQVNHPDMQVGCLSEFEKSLCMFKMYAKLDRKPM